MKKTFYFLFAVVLLISFATTCFANSTLDIIWEYEHISATVIFSGETTFSETEQKNIADKLVYGVSVNETSAIQPRAWCWLTGHKLTTEYVTVITHKVYTTAPRCVQEQYKVVTCANCDYEEMTLVSTIDISCCPVE